MYLSGTDTSIGIACARPPYSKRKRSRDKTQLRSPESRPKCFGLSYLASLCGNSFRNTSSLCWDRSLSFAGSHHTTTSPTLLVQASAAWDSSTFPLTGRTSQRDTACSSLPGGLRLSCFWASPAVRGSCYRQPNSDIWASGSFI